MKYKKLDLTEINEDTILLALKLNSSSKEEDVIWAMSQLVEYVEYTHPKHIIIDKRGAHFHHVNYLKNFLKKDIVDRLFSCNVQKIHFIVCQDRFNELNKLNGNIPCDYLTGYNGIRAYIDKDKCINDIICTGK